LRNHTTLQRQLLVQKYGVCPILINRVQKCLCMIRDRVGSRKGPTQHIRIFRKTVTMTQLVDVCERQVALGELIDMIGCTKSLLAQEWQSS
jgi:hypothetical protein